jgi:hypothetical protein
MSNLDIGPSIDASYQVSVLPVIPVAELWNSLYPDIPLTDLWNSLFPDIPVISSPCQRQCELLPSLGRKLHF